jgi:hypothetical protein
MIGTSIPSRRLSLPAFPALRWPVAERLSRRRQGAARRRQGLDERGLLLRRHALNGVLHRHRRVNRHPEFSDRHCIRFWRYRVIYGRFDHDFRSMH